jgi:hypothetical protein
MAVIWSDDADQIEPLSGEHGLRRGVETWDARLCGNLAGARQIDVAKSGQFDAGTGLKRRNVGPLGPRPGADNADAECLG